MITAAGLSKSVLSEVLTLWDFVAALRQRDLRSRYAPLHIPERSPRGPCKLKGQSCALICMYIGR